jgi:hypothetical protein
LDLPEAEISVSKNRKVKKNKKKKSALGVTGFN